MRQSSPIPVYYYTSSHLEKLRKITKVLKLNSRKHYRDSKNVPLHNRSKTLLLDQYWSVRRVKNHEFERLAPYRLISETPVGSIFRAEAAEFSEMLVGVRMNHNERHGIPEQSNLYRGLKLKNMLATRNETHCKDSSVHSLYMISTCKVIDVHMGNRDKN
jgi:hypothetical protein